MGKKTELKLNKARDRMAEMRCALEGVVKAVNRMVESEDERDYMATELAAVSMRQAMEEATRALGGSNWDDWGEWACWEGADVELPGCPEEHRPHKVFRNNVFEVWVTVQPMMGQEGNPPIAELSIKRRDKLAIDYNHYRTMQRIKNELLGPGVDAAMLYPCHQREQDSANQYRIYAMPLGMLMPFGDMDRLISSKAILGDDDPRNGSRQRPFAPEEKPYGDVSDNPATLKAVEDQLSATIRGEG